MQTFLEKFNEITDDKFSVLKLRKAVYSINNNSLALTFAYPEGAENSVLPYARDIETGAKRAMNGDIDIVEVKLVKSHFDRAFFLKDIAKVIKQFPMLDTMLSDKDIVTKNDANGISVMFLLDETLADYCQKKNAGKRIEEYIKNYYCGNVEVRFEPRHNDSSDAIEDFEREMEEEKSKFILEDLSSGREIQPENVEEFIGKIIYEKARYVSDAIVSDRVVLCGNVIKLKEFTKKDGSKKYYKFNLKDFTGEIGCLYFPTKKTENQITLLTEGKEIVAVGKVSEDTMREGNLTFWPHDISFCTLPKNFKVNRVKQKVNENYITVFPQPYSVLKQGNLFDPIEQPSEFLLGKTFCVFDLETTGFAPENDRIIEIGAVRIRDGKFIDTFNTYIDPKRPIPEKIITLTGIKDSDVMGQPTIEQVLPDFYKYTQDCILVGQNVQFDYGFISVNGAKQDIYFENEMMDTIVLAKKYVPTLKKYNLAKLTKYFNVENLSAHRGIYDAIATAEVFIKLVKMM